MNFASFDLNLLRVLDALLSKGSTVGAARRVGLSPPAVSAALGRLRHALRDELFLRKGGGLVPTDRALALAGPLRAALDNLQALLSAQGRFDPGTATQTFRISGADFFAEMLMPQLAETLQRVAPGMRVQLVDLVLDSHVETLDRHEVDLGLCPRTAFADRMHRQPVFRSPFAVVARRGNPATAGLGTGDTMPLETFCALGHVPMSPQGRFAAVGDAAPAQVGRQRRVVMTMPVFSGVGRAVAESDPVALLPTRLALRVAPRLGLDVFRPPTPMPVQLVVMFWHRRSSGNPAHRWLRGVIADLLAPLDMADTDPFG